MIAIASCEPLRGRIPAHSRRHAIARVGAGTLMTLGALLLAGCGGLGVLPDKPVRPSYYDFGPHVSGVTAATPSGVPLALAQLDVPVALDSTQMLYRLAYANEQMPKPYAHARWSMPPAQLVYQRLKASLGTQHPIVMVGEGYARIELRAELEEFSQVFTTPTESHALLRLRVTALAPHHRGNRLLGQRVFESKVPAATADAVGGVKAMTAATDQLVADLEAWLAQLQMPNR